MTISDSFTSEEVGLVPVGICFGSPKHFPVDSALGNVALAWKHLSPALPVTVLHPVSVEEDLGKVIFHVDAHCLAAFDEGIEECRNLRSGLGDAEKEGLSSDHKGSYHVFGSLIARCGTWNVEEFHKAFLPFERVCKSDRECAFRHGRYRVFTAEFKDSFKERFEYSSSFFQVFIIGGEISCKPPVPEQSFLMEEVSIKSDKFECSTGSPFTACLHGLAPSMNFIRDLE